MSQRRRGELVTFSLSFVDCIASALGAVIFLVLLLSILSREAAEAGKENALRVDVFVMPMGASPEKSSEEPTGLPCQVHFFLGRQEETGASWVPIAGRTGGPYGAQLRARRMLERAFVVEDPHTGWASLWLQDPKPGTWLLLVRLEALGEGAAQTAQVRFRIRSATKEEKEYQTTISLVPGRVTAFSFAGLGQAPSWGEALQLEVPGEQPQIPGSNR